MRTRVMLLLLGGYHIPVRMLELGTVPTLLAAVLAGLCVSLAARLAARLLRPRLRAALDPENLRVP